MSNLCGFVYFFIPFPLSPEPQERWHSRGQRFDPAYLHQVKRLETKVSSLFVLPLWCAALNRFAQINHVPELNVVFVYGVVVVGYEKVPHNVGTGEAAFFIEGDSERAVAGTDL